MVILQYKVSCPKCATEINLVAEEANPVIFFCAGCGRSVVMHNNLLFTVPEVFTRGMIKRFKSRACGRVLSTRLSKNVAEKITKDKIFELHKILQEPMDVKDFINRIK